jgi:hypothetical protein
LFSSATIVTVTSLRLNAGTALERRAGARRAKEIAVALVMA